MKADPSVPSAAWREQFVADNTIPGLQNSDVDDKEVSGGKRVEFRYVHGTNANTICDISFRSVPPGQNAAVLLTGAVKWRISEVGSEMVARVRLNHLNLNQRSTVHLGVSVEGTVELDLTAAQGVTVDDGCTGTMTLCSGELVVGESTFPDSLRFELAGGELGKGKFGTVHLMGEVDVSSTSNAETSINRLIVHGDKELHVSGIGGHAAIQHIEAEGKSSTLRVTRVTQQGQSTPQNTQMTISTVEGLSLNASSPVAVVVQARAMDVAFIGPTTVEFRSTAVGDRIRFEGESKQTPQLIARPGAVIDGVTGTVVIAGIEGAQVSGDPEGYTIVDISATRGGANNLCKDAFLSGFRIPRGLEGRSLLNHLDNAHHVEPATIDLPGWDLRYFKSSKQSASELRHDAELMRKLHELASDKGASGSVRTKIGWCAQRLRHKTTRGKLENVALLGYRALGYGERPGPPLATWLVLSLVFTGVLASINSVSICGLNDFIRLWTERAISPIGAVLGSGSGPESHAWLYLFRAFVAVPLVVAALALRNYVRRGR